MSIRSNINIGDIFSFWLVTARPPKGCLFTCLCTGCKAVERKIHYIDLYYNKTKSCGCKKKELTKQTSLEKYGTEHHLQAKQVLNKKINTCREKYGVDYVTQIPEVIKKRKQTFIQNYGVDNPRKSNLIKDKIKETMLQKYGLESYTQTLEYAEKTKETNLKKFGTEYYSQCKSWEDRMKLTNLEKYGVESYTQLPENRNKLKEWCNQHPEFNGKSNAEIELLSWTQTYHPSACKTRREGNELDIFIPALNLGVEYNGLYWHSELNKSKNYHLDKTNYFKEQGIQVIHIWEHEWKCKQEQVKSFLLSALGKNQHKIGARKCKLVWSSLKEEIKLAHALLDSTHIQGHTNSTKHVANAYYNDELLATATFGKHHRDSKTWVLTRFTTKTNYTIQGILSKISKLASGKLQSDIISWADNRLSDGNGYEKAGWKFEELMRPDYLYWKSGLKIISKQSRQKKLVNTPEGMTEHEHAKLDGLTRVYDCGKIRYRYDRCS